MMPSVWSKRVYTASDQTEVRFLKDMRCSHWF